MGSRDRQTWDQIRVQLFINYMTLGKFLNTGFKLSACNTKVPRAAGKCTPAALLTNVIAHLRNSSCVFAHIGTPTLYQVLCG